MFYHEITYSRISQSESLCSIRSHNSDGRRSSIPFDCSTVDTVFNFNIYTVSTRIELRRRGDRSIPCTECHSDNCSIRFGNFTVGRADRSRSSCSSVRTRNGVLQTTISLLMTVLLHRKHQYLLWQQQPPRQQKLQKHH